MEPNAELNSREFYHVIFTSTQLFVKLCGW